MEERRIEASASPIAVPPERLSREALEALAEEYLLVEAGSDQGWETSRTAKERVLKALARGSHLIVFDPGTETFGIVEARRHPEFRDCEIRTR